MASAPSRIAAPDDPSPAESSLPPGESLFAVTGLLSEPGVPPAPQMQPTSGMSRGRSTVVWGLVALAALIGFLSTLTTWVNRQALDTRSWTEASVDLINDPEVRSALSAYIVNEFYDNVDVSGQISKGLPPKYEALAGPISAALRDPAQQGVDHLLQRPRVVNLWERANRVAHQNLVAILENRTQTGVSTANGSVTLDLRTIVIELAKQLGLPGDVVGELPADAGKITIFHSEHLSAAQTAVKTIKILSVWLVVLVLLLWAVALYLALGSRRATLRDIGWSIIVVGLLLFVVRRLGQNYVPTTPQTRLVGQHVWLIGTQIIGQIGWALFAYGFATVLGAALAGPTRLATSLRAWLAPTLNTRQGSVWGVAGFTYLLLILWGPTHALRTPVGILLLGALAALGLYALRRQTLDEFPDVAQEDGPRSKVRVGEWWSRRPRRSHHVEPAVPAASARPTSVSATDELERLHALHAAGALSDEEFHRGKEHALA